MATSFKGCWNAHLNTSYVKVQQECKIQNIQTRPHLNTSYVKVQQMRFLKLLFTIGDLNTSYVKVQPLAKGYTEGENKFKYILC